MAVMGVQHWLPIVSLVLVTECFERPNGGDALSVDMLLKVDGPCANLRKVLLPLSPNILCRKVPATVIYGLLASAPRAAPVSTNVAVWR
jgi:hypothetical protein